jgi:hypothetical protein
LIERSGGCCEICGAQSRPEIKGCCLAIDHEHFVGQWAVRGLLCYVCNTALRSNRRIPPDPRIQQYIASAWYVQKLAESGLSDEIPPEPGLGSSVTTSGRSYMRYRLEGEQDWICLAASQTTFRSWRQLWREHGPFRLRVRDSRSEIPDYMRKALKPYLRSPATRPLTPSKAVLEERIGRARAIAERPGWAPADQHRVAEIIAALNGGFIPPAEPGT